MAIPLRPPNVGPHRAEFSMSASPPLNRHSETITHAGKIVCVLVRAEPVPEGTTFYTPNELELQVGRIVYPTGSVIARHRHPQVSHNVTNALEVVIVQQGRVIVDLYPDDQTLLCSRELGPGDLVILASGGHGFRILENAVLLEVKQGPYQASQSKELF
jgi:quercetin dioxygenase-like cupin family protein